MTEHLIIKALSERDRGAMSELVEEFFCSGLDEEEQGKQFSTIVHTGKKLVFRILLKCAMHRAGE